MVKPLRGLTVSLFFSALGGAVFYSCNKEEPIPAYIHIEKIDVASNYTTQGTAAHNVVDAWVYVDGELIGAFEMPVTFPVITEEGSHSIQVFAGVKIDGLSALRIPYPFYNSYTTTATLTPGQLTTISPDVAYFPGIVYPTYIPWLEDMEQAGVTLKDNNSEVQIVVDTVDEFEGNQSIKGTFASGDTTFLWQSQDSFYLSTAQNAIFLEVNYKCSCTFGIGLRYQPNQSLTSTFLTLNATNGVWKKVYVNLTDKFSVTNGLAGNGFYYIYFSQFNADGSLNGSSIQLDNIKLLKN